MSDTGPYRAPRRLYLSRDKARVVEEGDPEAGFLLAGEGAEVDAADVEKYGLRDLPEPETKMVGEAPADKARPAPRTERKTAPKAKDEA